MRAFWLIFSGLAACSSGPPAPAMPDNAPAPSSIVAQPEPGWGAVFWRESRALKLGGGPIVVGPRAVGEVQPATDQAGAPCGGSWITGAPNAGVLAPPTGAAPEAPEKPPAVSAALIETAAWRLDETLPPADAFTPIRPDAQPAQQRGVQVGSVVKARRYGAPPVLLAAGGRDCTGVYAILDRDAASAMDSLLIPGMCGRVRATPPADLDGDGQRELAVFDDHHVVAVRLLEGSGPMKLQALGEWRCPVDPG